MKAVLLAPVLCLLSVCLCSAHAQSESEGGDSSGDWDWDSFEVMDDTPVTTKGVIVREQPVDAERMSMEEVTQPDLEASSRAVYPLFAGMPEFEVIPSRKDSQMYPCSNCHWSVISNQRPRELKQPHDNFTLSHGLHGKGAFWCFTCHDDEDTGRLKTLKGETVAFEDAYIICSQCHVRQARDWVFGAHGKRRANWRGERRIYNCTACHYQHSPAFSPRDALPGPAMRMGLQRPGHWSAQAYDESGLHTPPPVWFDRQDKGHE